MNCRPYQNNYTAYTQQKQNMNNIIHTQHYDRHQCSAQPNNVFQNQNKNNIQGNNICVTPRYLDLNSDDGGYSHSLQLTSKDMGSSGLVEKSNICRVPCNYFKETVSAKPEYAAQLFDLVSNLNPQVKFLSHYILWERQKNPYRGVLEYSMECTKK